MASPSFVGEPDPTPPVEQMYAADRAGYGFVMNLSRVWGHQPALFEAYVGLATSAAETAGLTLRDRGVLVTALASTIGDAYCSIAWGGRLAAEAGDAAVPVGVLTGSDAGLDEREQALAAWARAVARDPARTTAADLQPLRDVGLDDAQVVAVTVFVAARIAFSTVNGALGARPDAELRTMAPPAVVDAVRWGRPIEPTA